MESHNNTPKLPDHYRAEKVAGMMPDQIVFAYDHFYSVDKNTKEIYVKTDTTITEQVLEPSYYEADRTALMKVFFSDGEEQIEGFIADLRFINPGSIGEIELTTSDDSIYSDTIYTEQLMKSMKNC